MAGSWKVSRHGGLAAGVGARGWSVIAGAFLIALIAFAIGQVAAHPSCSEAQPQVEQVQHYLASGQTGVALALAQTSLSQRQPPVCGQSQHALALLAYQAGIQQLYAVQRGDTGAAQQLPTRWQALEQQATTWGVPPDERTPAMTVATTAYDRGLWPLAAAAFRQAWQVGAVGAAQVDFYAATLRNWGHDLAFATPGRPDPKGVELLATANAIDGAYHLQSGVACADLHQLGIADCSQPAPDASDPVLSAAARP